MKNEKKHHGGVNESSSEQFFVTWTQLPVLCEKSGATLLVLVGLMEGSCPGGLQSDEILVYRFQIYYTLHR